MGVDVFLRLFFPRRYLYCASFAIPVTDHTKSFLNAHRSVPNISYLSMCTMLSDRKATVGYAVDLLRFHQVRRENAYLHAQTQAYHDELTLTKAEVKELKTAVQQCQADSENSHSLSKWYELRADQQGDQIRRLQRDLEMLKAETSKHQDESERNLTHATAETRLLEEKLFSRIETLCQQAADTSRSRLQTLNVRLDGFEAVLSNKADLTLVERLHRSIDPTQPPHASLDSVSRVDNSVEGTHDACSVDAMVDMTPRTSRFTGARFPGNIPTRDANKSSSECPS